MGSLLLGATLLLSSLAQSGARANSDTEPLPSAPLVNGYRIIAADGRSWDFGALPGLAPASSYGAVGGAGTPTGAGYWVTDAAGHVTASGDAANLGSAPAGLTQPVVGMAATPTGAGYWLVAKDGGIFSFGDARFYGSTGAIRLNQPIVGMAPTPAGGGYWLVARDGGIFTFGDADYRGSTGGTPLNQPIVGMAPTHTGAGYWLVAGDGGVFTFGDAPFLGAASTKAVALASTASEQSGILSTLARRKPRRTSTSDSTTTTTAPPSTTTTTAPPSSTVSSSTEYLPFSSTSAWNSPIIGSPRIDAKSSSMIAWLASGDKAPGVANLYRYGVPIWEATSTTPKYSVPCTRDWGTCGLSGLQVPIPDGAFPAPGGDAAMVVVDRAANRTYEFYDAINSGGWTTGWGGSLAFNGDGVGTAANSATGAAVSRLAGVVRTWEIKAGHIPHALVFSTDNACPSVYRYPAAKTDGRSTRTDCIPEGARVQLDPTLDVDAIAGMTPGERAVAKALQTYGAYAMDNGGARMAYIFEVPSGEADPYPSVGFTSDYFGMNKIPWTKLRVLASWNGA